MQTFYWMLEFEHDWDIVIVLRKPTVQLRESDLKPMATPCLFSHCCIINSKFSADHMGSQKANSISQPPCSQIWTYGCVLANRILSRSNLNKLQVIYILEKNHTHPFSSFFHHDSGNIVMVWSHLGQNHHTKLWWSIPKILSEKKMQLCLVEPTVISSLC